MIQLRWLIPTSVLAVSFGVGLMVGVPFVDVPPDPAEEHRELLGQYFAPLEVADAGNDILLLERNGASEPRLVLAISTQCSVPLGEVLAWAEGVERLGGPQLDVVLLDAAEGDVLRMAAALNMTVYAGAREMLTDHGIKAVPVMVGLDSANIVTSIATGSEEIAVVVASLGRDEAP